MKLGYRIHGLRIQKRITLKELAQKTGLTTSFLSQLERDRTSPSVSSLEKIAYALDTRISYFFEGEEDKDLVFVKKGSNRKIIDKDKKIFSESLASGFLNMKMQPQLFTISPGASLNKELIYPQGEKFGMVFKGKLKLLCNSKELILQEGDSIYCMSGEKLGKLVNSGKKDAKFLWINFGE